MKVVFALRADAFVKPGGDSKKVARYREGLGRLGWDTEVVTSAQDLKKSDSDLVHLMNLDTPRENLHYARIARKLRRPFVISTIRHPYEGMRSMYQFGDDPFYRALTRLGVGAEMGIGFREQVKLMKQKNVGAAVIPGRYRLLQKMLVKDASAVFPMALGEAEVLRQDFGSETPQKIIRNGFSFSPTSRASSANGHDFDLVSVGRIEPRKNSLTLARAAVQSGLSIAFIGALNGNHPSYSEKFLQVVESNVNVEYLGHQDHGAMTEILRRCDVYINPAWFEVVSQADVEAACLGLRIVSTCHSYLEDALGPEVKRFDPVELLGAGAGERLCELSAAATRVSGAVNRDWNDCSIDLDSAYREVLSNS